MVDLTSRIQSVTCQPEIKHFVVEGRGFKTWNFKGTVMRVLFLSELTLPLKMEE